MCGRIFSTLCPRYYYRPNHQDVAHHEHVHHGQSMYMAQHGIVLREDEVLVQKYGNNHWRVKGYRILHQHWFILLLAALMVADIIFMMVDLVLEAFYPECSVIMSGSSCELVGNETETEHVKSAVRLLQEPGTCSKSCVENPSSVEDAKVALTICSLIILALFLAELLFHMTIIGIKRFFGHVFLVIDMVIVCVSIGLEIYLLVVETSLRNNEGEQGAVVEATAVPLIIFARSWRLLRIGHGTYKEAHDFYGERIRKLEEDVNKLKERLTANNIPLEDRRYSSSSSSSSSSGRNEHTHSTHAGPANSSDTSERMRRPKTKKSAQAQDNQMKDRNDFPSSVNKAEDDKEQDAEVQQKTGKNDLASSTVKKPTASEEYALQYE